jgi:hypothetical protein
MNNTAQTKDRVFPESIQTDEHDKTVKEAIRDHHKELAERLKKIRTKQESEHKLALWFKRLGVGLITVGATLIVTAAIYDYSVVGIFGASSTVLAIGLFVFSIDHGAEERRRCDELKRLEFECDLLQLQPDGSECRAEKMLGNNDSQLRAYYELNLAQCSKIFWVGILCLCGGIGVIAATLQAVKMSPDDGRTQIIIGVIGAVGSVLINYVAAIFLKMHSEILTILKEFQSKLVDTQELYLANVLASRISDDATRLGALKDLSLAMVRREKAHNNGNSRKK